MNATHTKILGTVFAIATLCTAGGCAGMNRGERTAVGAGAGAVGGAVLTNGHPAGVIGGAVVGGVIGNQTDGGHRHRH